MKKRTNFRTKSLSKGTKTKKTGIFDLMLACFFSGIIYSSFSDVICCYNDYIVYMEWKWLTFLRASLFSLKQDEYDYCGTENIKNV